MVSNSAVGALLKLFLIPVVAVLMTHAQSSTSETPIIGHPPPGDKPVFLPTPEYPPSASYVGIEGKVVVAVVVDENGKVSEAKVTSGHPFLHANSLKAATSARFEPLRLVERTVRFRTTIVFEFKGHKNTNRPTLPIVNGRAIELPRPEFTQELKSLCASGDVGVDVLINEAGRVVDSKAVFGDELLHASAVKAAEQATFRQVADGPPVRSRGVLVYNFIAEMKCIDVGKVNGKWIKWPVFSVHPHAKVTRPTKITIRLGIEPFSGKVLAAKATSGHPLIRRKLEIDAMRIKFRPLLINSGPFIVKGVIVVSILPNGRITF
ncbi:MAG: TonB family protein [Acidobacteriota bacterium]